MSGQVSLNCSCAAVNGGSLYMEDVSIYRHGHVGIVPHSDEVTILLQHSTAVDPLVQYDHAVHLPDAYAEDHLTHFGDSEVRLKFLLYPRQQHT